MSKEIDGHVDDMFDIASSGHGMDLSETGWHHKAFKKAADAVPSNMKDKVHKAIHAAMKDQGDFTTTEMKHINNIYKPKLKESFTVKKLLGRVKDVITNPIKAADAEYKDPVLTKKIGGKNESYSVKELFTSSSKSDKIDEAILTVFKAFSDLNEVAHGVIPHEITHSSVVAHHKKMVGSYGLKEESSDESGEPNEAQVTHIKLTSPSGEVVHHLIHTYAGNSTLIVHH